MLNETKKDLTLKARQLMKPYEQYSIDDLANAYCDAVDTKNETLKDIYISALILRFWYTIDKMYRSNTVAPSLEREDFFWWLYEAIEYACKYRGWRDPNKKLNAQQCINKCISTIQLQKYYNERLDKYKSANFCCSIDTTIGDQKEGGQKTLADVLESDENIEEKYAEGEDVMLLVQKYINKNKIIEAILIDNIAFNDVQKHFKKTIKRQTEDGKIERYVEHSSQFWPYKLIQIVSKLPEDYKENFLERYNISEEKLTAILDVIDKANNQKLYRYLDKMLTELRATYSIA
jgi:uncharacterized protein YktA (UPF0223 family)